MVGEIEMMAMEGRCRYCGTIQPVMAADQIDADNKISADCSCGGSAREKKRLQILDNIDAIAGEDAASMGFSSVHGDTLLWLKRAGEMILDGIVDKIGVEIDGTKITIAITGKGDVKIKRSQTESAMLEA